MVNGTEYIWHTFKEKKNPYELCSYSVFGMFCFVCPNTYDSRSSVINRFLVAISITHKKQQQQQK